MIKHARLLLWAVLLFAFVGHSPAFAQQRPMVGCVDPGIRQQGDEIKQYYLSRGFTVYRDAMLNMESMTPLPVLVPLERGQRYQIIFVSHQAASRLKIELFDGNDKMLEERQLQRKQEEPNYLLLTFNPRQTDTYLLTFLQKLKKERMCGSLCILKMPVPQADADTIRPYKPWTGR